MNGIKGLSISFVFLEYDVIKGISIVYMYIVFFGIVKMFMLRWFDIVYRYFFYYCGDKLFICDLRRVNIKSFNYISRIFRSFNDRVYYKVF